MTVVLTVMTTTSRTAWSSHKHFATMHSSSVRCSGLDWRSLPRSRCQCFSSRLVRPRAHADTDAASDLAAAWTLLKTFSKQEFQGRAQQQLGTAAARQELRDALLLAYRTPCPEESWSPGPGPSPEVLLGLVASDSRLAVRALRDWCQALDLPYTPPDCKVAGASSIAAVNGAVYVKFNSVSRVCYMSQYQGRDRGVLVQLGAGQLLGHFPLGFWDEAMANPAPSLEPASEQQPQPQ